jgi:hypothetical protein
LINAFEWFKPKNVPWDHNLSISERWRRINLWQLSTTSQSGIFTKENKQELLFLDKVFEWYTREDARSIVDKDKSKDLTKLGSAQKSKFGIS